MAATNTLEAMEQSITYWYHQRTKTPYNAKVVLYTGTDVTGLGGMRVMLENLLECLGKIQGTTKSTPSNT